MRYVGLDRSSKEARDLGLDTESMKSLQAFSNGVNDYVQDVSWSMTDNTTAVAAINKGVVRSAQLMELVRELRWLQAAGENAWFGWKA